MNIKCVFGYCKGNKDNLSSCQRCGENAKKQGYTGCIYAVKTIEEAKENE